MSAPQRRVASGDDASSDEWFTRYVLDAAFIAILVLAAVGVSCYLNGNERLGDWSRDLGSGFLLCLMLSPVLGVLTLGFAIHAGIRVFLRPHTFEHALVRLTFLAGHAFVFLICLDTVLSMTASLSSGLDGSVSPEARAKMVQSWGAIEGRDYTGSQYDSQDGPPAGLNPSFSPLMPGSTGMGAPSR